ncbi:uncharacterized protein LOC124173229 [Ischnura elegans]|uniref:uncharacterized protein LOC124173229 n=1 Tax=Ischnura elegans TaxID=197161 RepID=UPI001ED881F4|nr:uncharacterized protein LOC124173229 [Ischnura elegans]
MSDDGARANVGGGLESGRRRCRVRASNLFFIRLTPPEVYDGIREDVRDSLPPCVSWFVCLECDGRTGVFSHLHVFLKTIDKWPLSDLVNYFDCVFDKQYLLDVQKCRSERNTLKYCSKEDKHLLTNHRNNYKFFENFYKSSKKEEVPDFKYFKEYNLSHCEWADRCALWWNSKIKGWYHKQKNSYLNGEKNCGKSSFVSRLVGRENMKFSYYPDVSKFAFGDLDVNFHKVIIYEEFDIQYYCISMLKRLLEGLPFCAPQKFTSGQVVTWRQPVIFVSNDFKIFDDALLCRLQVVQCNGAYVEEKARLLSAVKIEESESICEEEEIYTISSSDDK